VLSRSCRSSASGDELMLGIEWLTIDAFPVVGSLGSIILAKRRLLECEVTMYSRPIQVRHSLWTLLASLVVCKAVGPVYLIAPRTPVWSLYFSICRVPLCPILAWSKFDSKVPGFVLGPLLAVVPQSRSTSIRHTRRGKTRRHSSTLPPSRPLPRPTIL
jgi:hypothetical protein